MKIGVVIFEDQKQEGYNTLRHVFNHNSLYQFHIHSHDALEAVEQTLKTDPSTHIVLINSPHTIHASLQDSIHKIKTIRREVSIIITNPLPNTIESKKDIDRILYQFNPSEIYQTLCNCIDNRFQTPFFNALQHYAKDSKVTFHALPISQGNSVKESPWIQDFYTFFGENSFISETSATIGGLDSLLHPTGPLKQAQEKAASFFGSQKTYYVTNGTSTSNKIVLQSIIQPDDYILIASDCHKSMSYGSILAGARIIYLPLYPLDTYSMYGAVTLDTILEKLSLLNKENKLHQLKAIVLTHITFDGIAYHPYTIMKACLAYKKDLIFLWDEAWFALAQCHPLYRQRNAMTAAYKLSTEKTDTEDYVVRVYSTQSTHKTLSAFRQSSMIHCWDEKINEEAFEDAYLTHSTTSPNYPLLASLDIARRQADLEGYARVHRCITLSLYIRDTIQQSPDISRYFTVLEYKDLIPHETSLGETLKQREDSWRLQPLALDPTRITLQTSGTGLSGNLFKSLLMDNYHIQVNKTSKNTVLFIINIGITPAHCDTLISILKDISKHLDESKNRQSEKELTQFQSCINALNTPDVALPTQRHIADKYTSGVTDIACRLAYYDSFCSEKTYYRQLDIQLLTDIQEGHSFIAASFITPYPPGFPIVVPGQLITEVEILFLLNTDIKEIHGYNPRLGIKLFKTEDLS